MTPAPPTNTLTHTHACTHTLFSRTSLLNAFGSEAPEVHLLLLAPKQTKKHNKNRKGQSTFSTLITQRWKKKKSTNNGLGLEQNCPESIQYTFCTALSSRKYTFKVCCLPPRKNSSRQGGKGLCVGLPSHPVTRKSEAPWDCFHPTFPNVHSPRSCWRSWERERERESIE